MQPCFLLGTKRKAQDESKENEENSGENIKQKKQKRKSENETTYKISKIIKECYVITWLISYNHW